MYFDFEDYRPDTPTIERAISSREAALLSMVLHGLAVLAVVFLPQVSWLQVDARAAAERAARLEQLALARQRNAERFVFVRPRLDLEAIRPPPRAELSDKDRQARSVVPRPNPTNPLPYSRGNSSERVEADPTPPTRAQGADTETAAGRGPQPEPGRSNGSRSPLETRPAETGAFAGPRPNADERAGGGSLGDALQNLQRYVERQNFDNQQGGTGQFGPAIQFDTKGVEFGPWIRRFVAQIKRNWFIPYAAMALKGHVVITFNVHRDGAITDLQIVQPSAVDAFNHAAFNALVASNPTQPLPVEYPAPKAFFTVTFFYNETPPPDDGGR